MTASASFRVLALITLLLSACAFPDRSAPSRPAGNTPVAPATPAGPPPAPHSLPGADRTDVLLFTGASAWMSEVESLESILYAHGTTYVEADSARLNAMPLDELARFALLVFPGGDAPTMTQSLSPETHAKLREAVQERGISYMGFCAGAWLAVSPAPPPGEDVPYGIGFVYGPFEVPSYLEKQGKEFAISRASFPDGTQRDLLWYGGPITPDIPGGVVAKYPDGTPAISEIRTGNGFAILSGLHPTANQAILNVLGLNDPEAIAPDFAWKMLESAIHQRPLPAF